MRERKLPSGAAFANDTIPGLMARRCREKADQVMAKQWRGGAWQELRWSDYADRVAGIAAALREAGLQKGDRVAILGDSSLEWLLADMATICAGGVTVGVYFTSSSEEVSYYLEDSGSRFIFVGAPSQLEVVLDVPFHASLQKIVMMQPDWQPSGSLPANLVTLESFRRPVDAPLKFIEDAGTTIRTHDMASIGYTSGTTGNPKGAMLHHLAMLAGANTLGTFGPDIYDRPHRVAVHLPMSHTVARAQATTLPLISQVIPHFGDNTANFAETIRNTRPNYYMAPPRFYQRFAAELLSRLQDASAERRQAYDLAIAVAKKMLQCRQAEKPADSLLTELYESCRRHVFVPMLAEIGFDELTSPFTASAPMPSEVMRLWQLWGLQLKECYGQTEMVGGNLGQLGAWPKAGTVGSPIPDPAWQTRLLDDGEMIVKGPGVFTGYLNKPEETAKTLKDGWLYTGDIFENQKNGEFKLVDRKKEIITTSGGKSISPAQIENEIRKSPYISEVAVVGDGRKYLTALVEVDASIGMQWARERDANVRGYEDLAKSEVVARLIEGEIGKANKHFARVEQIKNFRILPEELSPATGVMTPTRKKKRKEIAQRYAALIESMYDDSEEKLIRNAMR